MDTIIKKLSKFGALTIENEYDYWHVGCVVHNPDYSENKYVKATSVNLYFACRDLLTKVQEEHKKLLLKPHGVQISFIDTTKPPMV